MYYTVKWNHIKMFLKNSDAHISKYISGGTTILIYVSVREYNQNSVQRHHVHVI